MEEIERGERYRERMADVSEKVAGHLESMEANEILSRSSQVEKIDTVARRTFGLDSPAAGSGALNLNVLSGGRAIVQVNQKNEKASDKFIGGCHQGFSGACGLRYERDNAPEKNNNPLSRRDRSGD